MQNIKNIKFNTMMCQVNSDIKPKISIVQKSKINPNPTRITNSIKDEKHDEYIVRGFITTFKNIDRHGDVITEEAGEKIIKNTKLKNIKVLYDHSIKYGPIGRIKSLEIREFKTKGKTLKGIYAEIALLKSITGSKKVINLHKKKLITKFSIGFEIIDYKDNRFDENNHIIFAQNDQIANKKPRPFNVREIKEINLLEVSIVLFPANEQAKIVFSDNLNSSNNCNELNNTNNTDDTNDIDNYSAKNNKSKKIQIRAEDLNKTIRKIISPDNKLLTNTIKKINKYDINHNQKLNLKNKDVKDISSFNKDINTTRDSMIFFPNGINSHKTSKVNLDSIGNNCPGSKNNNITLAINNNCIESKNNNTTINYSKDKTKIKNPVSKVGKDKAKPNAKTNKNNKKIIKETLHQIINKSSDNISKKSKIFDKLTTMQDKIKKVLQQTFTIKNSI